MFFVGVGEDETVIKVDVDVGDVLEDFISKFLKAGRSITESKGQSFEFEEAPGSIDAAFQLILVPDGNKMECFYQIHFTEESGSFYVGRLMMY